MGAPYVWMAYFLILPDKSSFSVRFTGKEKRGSGRDILRICVGDLSRRRDGDTCPVRGFCVVFLLRCSDEVDILFQ